MCIALGACSGIFLWFTYQTAVADGGRLSRVLGRVLADDTDNAITETLAAMEDAVAFARRTDPDFAGDEAAIDRYLGDAARPLAHVRRIAILDRAGRLRYASAPPPQPDLPLGDQPFFAALAADPRRDVHINPPQPGPGPIENRPAIHLSKPIRGPIEEFAGVIVATIEPGLLTAFHRALEYDDRTIVGLIDMQSRRMLARVPRLDETLGREIRGNQILGAAASGRSSGTFDILSSVDGERRIMSFQRLKSLPAVITVGLSRNAVLESWYRQAAITVLLAIVLIVAGVIIARKIRETEAAATALGTSEARFRELFDNNPNPMWVYDIESLRFLEVNRRAIEVYGYSRAEFLGMPVLDLALPEDVPRMIGVIAARRGTGHKETEWRLHTRAGQVLDVLTATHDIQFDGRPGILVATLDITAWRRAEAQLLQAQKMEAIGLLTGGIAHDFNNLLTVIIGSSDKLQRRLVPGSLDQQLAEMVRAAGDRAAELIRDLLAVARRQALRPIAVDIDRLASDMTGLLRRTIGEDIDIQTVLTGRPWPVFLDRAQLESTILNLTLNARDAMPVGGKLTIETGNLSIDAAYAEMNPDLTVGDYVVLSVSDTGHGMAPEVAARAFEPFFTTKEIGKGSGLGLAMVFGFVKQSNGHAKIYSEPGKGTSVRLYLPRHADAAGAAPAPVAELVAIEGGSERLLLVEDDAMVRSFAAAQLRELGYDVTTAENGVAARDLLRSAAPFDLLVTDVVMPGGLGGREVARLAMELQPAIKVLYISGYTQNSVLHHGRVDAGVQLLSKPFTRAQLARAIREALGAVAAAPVAPS